MLIVVGVRGVAIPDAKAIIFSSKKVVGKHAAEMQTWPYKLQHMTLHDYTLTFCNSSQCSQITHN